MECPPPSSIQPRNSRQRETLHHLPDLVRDSCLDRLVIRSFQELGDIASHYAAFLGTKPTCRYGRSPQADTARLGRRAGVARDRVLVAGDSRAVEQFLGLASAE